MKQCPVCKTTYSDNSIDFCLNDGTKLFFYSEEPATQRISFDRDAFRVDIPKSEPTIVSPNLDAYTAQPAPKKGKVLIVGALLSLMTLFVIGVFGFYWIFVKKDNSAIAANTNHPLLNDANQLQNSNSQKTPARNTNETAELREKLDKLEKQLAEQQKKDKKPTDLTAPVIQKESLRTATVNSPGDGYLALRTAPNSKTGTQILKIPHGAGVTVGNCTNVARADGKTGKWCQVVYEGQAGWAFDGFLVY